MACRSASNRSADAQRGANTRELGVAPRDTTLGDVAKAAARNLLCNLLLFILLVVFPSIARFLPGPMD